MPSGGAVELLVVVPDSLALVGVVVRQQVVALELDAQGAFVGASSTNGLAHTVGAF